jgi:SAM-dependent methyltransferase
MGAELRRRVEVSGYDEPGFAERYDRARPRPPQALRTLVPPLLGGSLRRVVDLGCGTGLSTRLWADLADEVIGIEPSGAMRAQAVRSTAAPNVRYLEGSGMQTGLEAGSVDLVTASQSLHWMDPEPTFREIARILRPDGLLCAYEYFNLTTPIWELEAAYGRVREAVGRFREELGLNRQIELWPVTAERIRASRLFADVRETAVHSVEERDGASMVDLSLSEGSTQSVLLAGISEEAIGLDRLREAATAVPERAPWWIGYRVWLARR